MNKVIPKDAILLPPSAELVFRGVLFDIYHWPQKLFDGSEQTFEMIKRKDTVSIIGIVEDKIVVIDDEQPHIGKRKCFPGGQVDEEDLTIEAAAQREMIEETGYQFNNWRLIDVRQPYRKAEWFIHLWIAWDSDIRQEIDLDPGEKIDTLLVDFGSLKKLVNEGVDYLAEVRQLIKNINSTDDLLKLSEFSGAQVDR